MRVLRIKNTRLRQTNLASWLHSGSDKTHYGTTEGTQSRIKLLIWVRLG